MRMKGFLSLMILAAALVLPLPGFAAVTLDREEADFSASALPAGWTTEGGAAVSNGTLSLEGTGNCSAEFTLPAKLEFGPEAPEGEAVFEMDFSTGQTGDWTTGCKDKEVNFLDAAGNKVLTYTYNPDGWFRAFWLGRASDVDMKNLSYNYLQAVPDEAVRWRILFNLKASTFSIQIKGKEDADYYTPYYYDSGSGNHVSYQDIPLPSAVDLSRVKIWFYGNDKSFTNSVKLSNFSYPVLRTEDTDPPYWGSGAALRAESVSPGSVTLAWDAAEDDSAVAKYNVYQGGAYVGQTAALTYTVSGLEPETAYTFEVEAVDEAANKSETRLSVQATTGAETAYLLGIEDFETTAAGSVPETWLEGQTVVEEADGNHAMKAGYGGSAKYKLPSKLSEGRVSLYFDMKIDDPADVKWITVYDSQNQQAAQVGAVPDDFNNVGLYCYYYSDGWQWGNFLQTQPNSDSSMAAVSLNEWNTIRLDLDLDAHTFSILYRDENGEFQPTYRMGMSDTFMSTNPGTGALSTVEFNASMSTAGYLLDNFRYPLLPGDDKNPPVWVRPNVSEGSVKGGDFAWIDWADALCSDNAGVAEYRIYSGDKLVATVDGGESAVKVTGLRSETQYTFEVRAVDQNQNQSKNNPTVTLTTGTVSVEEIRTPERLSSGSQTAVVKVGNKSAKEQAVTVIAAVYEGSRMTDMKTAVRQVAGGGTEEISVTAAVGSVGPNTRMRVFVVDCFGSMTLLNEPVEVLQ